MKISRRKRTVAASDKPLEMPPLPSLLTRPLGLEGWTAYEPVLLAALASEDPLLLIGPHGSAKSFLLERLAQSLDLEFRFYNASLINYDDLVGIPMPDEERKSLRYISTPSAVWNAEVVFIDEISRTRPELQNKLFPIIHERRIQGVPLERLRYRWSAMNPPPVAGRRGRKSRHLPGRRAARPRAGRSVQFLDRSARLAAAHGRGETPRIPRSVWRDARLSCALGRHGGDRTTPPGSPATRSLPVQDSNLRHAG